MCNLYRVWSRVLVSEVILRWSHTLPCSVMGCLKGRSSSDLAYAVSSSIEQALQTATDLSGLAVDLTKAFNFLARAPFGELLCWMGLPQGVVQFWLRCVSKVSRCFQVCGSLSAKVSSTCGAPEGDPVSVIAMIGVCTALASQLSMVSPHFYVDNWSWTAQQPGAHGAAIAVLREYTDSLLTIDWSKSYAWSVHPASKKWFKKHLPACLPGEVQLPVLSHVRELGVQIQFGKKICLQHVSPRSMKPLPV